MRIRLAALVLLALPAIAAATTPVTGRWKTEDGKAIVTIAPCGKAICGHVTRILAAAPKGPLTDIYNPDPALRKRPILGLPILTGFTADGDAWKGLDAATTYAPPLPRLGEANFEQTSTATATKAR